MKKAKSNFLITKIEFKKKEILLHYLKDEEEKEISLFPTVYSDFFLYEGKELSETELKDIQKKNAYAKSLQIAYNYIAEKEYSVADLRKKLQLKNIPETQILSIIDTLLEQNLLNDRRYAEDVVEIFQARYYGKNYIIKKLQEDSISSSIISSFIFDNEKEKEKMDTLLPLFLRKHEKDNQRMKKEHLYREFLKYGYDSEMILNILSHVENSCMEDEMEKCRKELQKYQVHYQKKYSNYEYHKRIIATLMRKGFSYDIIKQVMESVNDGTDESDEMD